MAPSACRAVIFDLFDTLTVPYDDGDFSATLAAMASAVDAPPAALAEVWDRNWKPLMRGDFADSVAAVREACRTLALTCSSEREEVAAGAWDAWIRRAMTPTPEAQPTLTALRRDGRRIGLISDSPPGVPRLWSASPLAPLVDAAVFSCEVRLTKPDPAIYLHACERLGEPPSACLYVADGVGRELTGAAQVGMTPVLLRRPGPPPNDYRRDAREWRGPTVTSIASLVDWPG